ncbi:MAG: sigma-70 family RNA polymerase sigma factor [Candidatus Colwellbacteria bacterium]|nr:sigma-70 family RNA polymerase sigma factor [Candidatus Colwellbacteria bacterium]
MLEDEKNLIKKAKDGESHAFGLLYDWYLPKIYRFVLLKVSHREEAEDITHQVFLKAWTGIADYNHRGFPFGSWLYRIARNSVIDHYRSSGRVGTEISLESAGIELPDSENKDSKIDSKLQLEVIMQSIPRLKEVEQDVLLMRFVDDMPHEEVANVIGKSVGATKLIQHRAIRNLKDILKHDRR